MDCRFIEIAPGRIRCERCGYERPLVGVSAALFHRRCEAAPEDEPAATAIGPGTELRNLLRSIGIYDNASCGCKAKMGQMNDWGVAGCREHFDEIVGWMRDGQQNWGWKDKLAAAAKAVTTGIAFKVNWSDPFPGLIELAIELAQEKAAEKAEGDALPV